MIKSKIYKGGDRAGQHTHVGLVGSVCPVAMLSASNLVVIFYCTLIFFSPLASEAK
jgi:hypothetical protein